jgi:DNA-binding NarL/FixJ family response regulator
MASARRPDLRVGVSQTDETVDLGVFEVDERRLDAHVRVLPSIALEAFDAPVFIVDGTGAVLDANVAGDRLMRAQPNAVRRALLDMAAPGRVSSYGALTPLRELSDGVPRFLAVLRLPLACGAEPARANIARWKLTARQHQVLELVSRGLTNADIGKTLGILEGTVEFHISGILEKAGVENRATLIARLLAIPEAEAGHGCRAQ